MLIRQELIRRSWSVWYRISIEKELFINPFFTFPDEENRLSEKLLMRFSFLEMRIIKFFVKIVNVISIDCIFVSDIYLFFLMSYFETDPLFMRRA